MIAKALKAPETAATGEGQYDVGLIHGIGLATYEGSGEAVCPAVSIASNEIA